MMLPPKYAFIYISDIKHTGTFKVNPGDAAFSAEITPILDE